MAGNNGPKIVTNGLVLALDAADKKSYSGSGTAWNDLSGNNNNVIATNSPTWNSAGYWTNTSTSYFTGPGSSSIPIGNSQYTMICWVRQRAAVGWGPQGNNGFMSIGGFGTNNQSNALRTNANTVGYIYNYWWNNDLYLNNNNAGLDLDVWFMLAATFDGTTRRIWLNGVSRASDTPLNHNVTSTTINVSASLINVSPYTNEYQNGDMAAAYIYNRGLTSNEITQNFNAQRRRFSI